MSNTAATNASAPGAAPAAAVYVGIDVSKDTLDLARSDIVGGDGQAVVQTFSNDADAIRRIVQQLADVGLPALKVIVIESTGGLERPLLEALLEASLPAALVHPGRVRHLAKALGIEAKTDRIDARVLVRFGQQAAPRLAERLTRTEAELRDLVACRRQLCTARAQQSNRRGSTFSKAALKSIDAVMATMDRQIDRLDKQIRELIDADDDFKHLDGLLRSVPGVGPTFSATLAADLRELGETDRQRVCALVGVAPFPDDSGTVRGKRAIRGGRSDVRSVLYMVTLAAIRSNPVIRAFAQRLKKGGKIGKVVIVACMRKLLTLLNAMVRDDLMWEQLTVVKKLASTR